MAKVAVWDITAGVHKEYVMHALLKPASVEPLLKTIFKCAVRAMRLSKPIANIDKPVCGSPTIDSVPVVCGDGGPQFDRADVPTAEAETILGRDFETESKQERVL
jgi:hypothetical protein